MDGEQNVIDDFGDATVAIADGNAEDYSDFFEDYGDEPRKVDKEQPKEDVKEQSKEEVKDDKAEVAKEQPKEEDYPDWFREHSKSLLAKGFDPKAPDYNEKLTKSYAEAERYISRTTAQLKAVQERDDKLTETVFSDIDRINELRTQAGIPPLPKGIDPASRIPTLDNMRDSIFKAFEDIPQSEITPKSIEAVNKILSAIDGEKSELEKYAEFSKYNKNPNEKSLDEWQQTASKLLHEAKLEDPRAVEYLDLIAENFVQGSPLNAVIPNIYKAVGTKESMNAMIELGKRLSISNPETIEKIVAERVEKELKKLANKSNGKPNGRTNSGGGSSANFDYADFM